MKVKVHRSVRTRIRAKGPKGTPYLPKARFWIGDEARSLWEYEWLAKESDLIEWVGDVDPPKDGSTNTGKDGSTNTGKKGV